MKATTMEELISESHAAESGLVNVYAPHNRIAVHPFGLSDAPVTLRVDNLILTLDDWAMSQLGRIFGLPARYMARCPNGLTAENLRYWLSRNDNDRVALVRFNPETMRAAAFLSDRYMPISHTFVLMRAEAALEKAGLLKTTKLVKYHMTPRFMSAYFVIGYNPGGAHGFGVCVRNGNVGNSMLQILPMVQVTACTNSLTVVPGGWRFAHIAGAIGDLSKAADHWMLQALTGVFHLQDLVSAAGNDPLPPRIALLIAGLARRYRLRKETVNLIVKGMTDQTRLGLANGLSFAAHAAGLSHEDEARLEDLAGIVLWENQLSLDKISLSLGGSDA